MLSPVKHSASSDGDSACSSAIDCPSAHLCVAVDGSHDAFTATHPTGGVSAWKRVSGIDGDLNALSCPTTTLCFAVDGDGGVIVGHP